MQSTAIALPETIASKVKPRPTKADLVEALARRKFDLISARATESKAALVAQELHCTNLIKAYGVDHRDPKSCTVTFGHLWQGKREGVSVRYEFGNLPSNLTEALKRYDALKSERIQPPDFDALKKEIRSQMADLEADRAEQLLKDPAACRALDALLKKLES